jgi:hypothetical protein
VATFASLSCGVSAEILGVSNVPADDKSWWTAGGSPLPHAPLAKFFTTLDDTLKQRPNRPALLVRQVALRLRTPVGNNLLTQWSVSGASTEMDNEDTRSEDGKSYVQSQVYGAAILPPNSIVFRVDVATAPAETIAECGAEGRTVLRDGQSYVISKVTENAGSIHFRLTRPRVLGGNDTLVVIDNADQRHDAQPERRRGDQQTSTIDYTAQLPINQLKQIRLELRRFDQWIEISNITVDPAHPTEPRLATSENTQGL